ISDNFNDPVWGSKTSLRELAQAHINHVQDVQVWDFRFEGRPEQGKDYNGLQFQVKMTTGASLNPWYDCRAVFEYDRGRKEWLLKGLKRYNPGTTEEAK